MSEANINLIYGGENRSLYLVRVILGRLRIHVFVRGDQDPDPHDHPADFWTFPLNSYTEERWIDGKAEYHSVKAFRLHFRKAEHCHRVIAGDSDHGRICTISWWSKKRREWGFWVHLDDTGRRTWVPCKQYVKHPLV